MLYKPSTAEGMRRQDGETKKVVEVIFRRVSAQLKVSQFFKTRESHGTEGETAKKRGMIFKMKFLLKLQ